MSAWIVSRAHIDVMVQALCESETVAQDPDTVGRKLWAENLKSVAYRYPNDNDGDRPGPLDFADSDVVTYEYRRPQVRLTRHDQLNALACFDYQSCEHPGSRTSEVGKWVNDLTERLDSDGAKSEPKTVSNWGLDEAEIHPQARVS